MRATITRRAALAASLALPGALAAPRIARAETVVRLGVLTDISGPYSANTGEGSVVSARIAAEEFRRGNPGIAVEVVQGDFQSKPDIGSTIARQWFDRDGVHAILDVPSSALALVIADLARERDRIALLTGPGLTDLTGKACGPNHAHWTFDNWSFAAGTGNALLAEGLDTWFFVAANYSFGQSLTADATEVVKAGGGRVLGSTFVPFPGTTDFASFLVQAQASRAKVVALANSGTDMVNCVKQAREFGLTRRQRLAGMAMQLGDVRGAGLEVAQGMVLTEPYYWDLNDGTRDFAARFGERMGGAKPSMIHAGTYSAALHYLRAVAALGPEAALASGRATLRRMKEMPTDDAAFGRGTLRADGRKMHDMYLFEVKSPAESSGPWDCYKLRRRIPAADAFRSPGAGGCRLT
ncbi:ABC transporter substrate-binding protein [Roseomonas populi]|uniref:ABC transporter substrate-binding protein n=1 Tax=Roseomonas populi TaxID=3121582 RepID=A0ABT1WZW1_9PROT|nr:ABC transporter substrate-binding protein [Roseomonas pecuniae]MCR0981076.1 ABC transporter substrate-binding protein [Roseomonas pecuniae]